MDSLAESKWIKSLKFSSLHTAGVFNTTTTTTTTTLSCTTTTTTKILKKTANICIPRTIATKDFSFNANPQRKTSLLLRNIWRNIQHYITTIARLFFYVFLILGLTDGFNLGTVLAISEHKSRSDFINISTTSSSLSSSTAALLTVLSSSAQQLPIEALILVANSNTAADVRNNSNSKLSQTTATTTTRTTANNGFNSYQRHNNSMHDNNNNNNSINIYNADKTAAWATFSNSNTLNSITSTLSSQSGPFTFTTSSSSSSSSLLSSSSSTSIFMYNDNTSATSKFPATFDAAVPPASPSNTTPTDEEFTTPAVHTVLVSIVLLFVILGTIVGNVLVCIAVCMVRKLRRPCNYLLVSLALSDLCVAVLVMPMALLYEVLEKWNFGPVLCDIWVSFDVLCCTASILNLCAISVDRYLAITKPLEYGVKRTPRRMMLCVALVWLAAACISLPPLLILGNEHVDENGNPMCSVCQNFAYQIYATLGSFYIPLAVMLFVYYQIFRAARRIVLEEKRAQTHLQHALNGTGSPPGHTELGGGGGGNGQQHRHSSYGNTSLNYSNCGVLSTSQASGTGGGSGSSGLLGSPHQKKLRFQLAKEKKASTTLGIIMSAFTICWLPFFILALIRPFVESETTHVPQSLSSLFLWLGYANSLLNPIIYATLNRDFRKPFQEILYFRCSSLNTMMRENYYQDQYGEPPSQRVMLGDERHGARESFL